MMLQEPNPGYIFTFGYGSNMCLGRLRCRVPSACPTAVAELLGYKFAFHKRSDDTSGKGNAFRTGAPIDRVLGVVFEIREEQRNWLDDAEGMGQGYRVQWLLVNEVGGSRRFKARTYIATKSHIDPGLKPFTWYKRHVVEGARHFELAPAYIAAIEGFDAIVDKKATRVEHEVGFPCAGDVGETSWKKQKCNGPGPEACA
jgi:hypothetical protein